MHELLNKLKLVALLVFACVAFLTLGYMIFLKDIGAEQSGVVPSQQLIIESDDILETCESQALFSDTEYTTELPVEFIGARGEPDRAEYEPDLALMRWEVIKLWELFFDDDGAKQTDPRREMSSKYAEYVIDAVTMYQDSPTDIGGQLPTHKNVHLLVAWMIAKESSVTNGVVGKLGEVGMMQIMPTNKAALAGYSPKKIKNNPKLSIMLGVRWMAYTTSECPNTDIFDTDWNDLDWVKPLSAYAGGQNAKRENGTCKSFTVAKERVQRTMMYRTRIDQLVDTEYLTD
ncbi:MAG: lytic transglycosylase domain-containing protein [FCB group bacterium]|nr:lytic transglycosylase domain-containing protein [FCB group bacterium]